MSDKDKTETALKRYDALLRYFAHEQMVYWSRTQFYLVANAGLLAVIGTRLGEPKRGFDLLLLGGCIFGLALSLLWRLNLRSARHWTSRWENILRDDLEADAFGTIEVLRNN